MKQFFFFVFLILFSTSSVLAGEDVRRSLEQNFFQANRLYFEGQYLESLNAYKAVLEEPQFKSFCRIGGDLFYNMGNCHYRLGNLGYAILYYERAKIFMPRDADLKFNLEYLQDKIKDEIAYKAGIIDSVFFWVKALTLNELIIIFSIINFLFFFIVSLRFFYKTESIYYFFIFLLTSWLVSSVSLGIKSFRIYCDQRVVIVNREVEALAGPDKKDTLLFKLHEGAIVSFERSESDFSLIRLPDGRRGWLASSSVKFIVPDNS